MPTDLPVMRDFNSLYILVDLIWLATYVSLLAAFKRRTALAVGAAAGVVFFVVDYGVFHLALGTREVNGAHPFWFLLWLSMSYGITTFAWMWLLLDRDRHAVEWSVLTGLGWFLAGFVSQSYGADFAGLSIRRGTVSYHGAMVVILVCGYLLLAIRNMRNPAARVNLLRLLAIGVGVQFAWEFALLVSGIRPFSIVPLIRNSLVETNLGVPWMYLIHKAVSGRRKEGGADRK